MYSSSSSTLSLQIRLCDAVEFGRSIQMFQKNLLCPVSALKMEVEDSSETLVPIYQTMWHHSPENCNANIPWYENLRS
jgi:hypothetical protein